LSERGIPFAETYALIKTRKELREFDFKSLPKTEFVAKPNHGSKGRGIVIVNLSDKLHPLPYTQFVNILDGEYSMTSNDSILIEEKIVPGTDFKDFCAYGLADVRIIVFNLVPVAAEIRIPTEKSEGKANIAAGGLGCGIDIQTGKIFSSFIKRKLYKHHFPAESEKFQGKKIPFRDDLLFLSSKIQYFVNL
jgi:hypothetical protein